MGFTLRGSREADASVVEELRAQGVPYEDIRTALDLQEHQRRLGVPVMPLRAMCGLETVGTGAHGTLLDTTRALVTTSCGGRPQGGLHITRRKIWANSVKTDSPEESDFVRPLGEAMRNRLFVAANRVKDLARDLATEARAGSRTLSDPDKKIVQFTTSCWEILRALVWHEQRRKGWLTPDYETIMKWTRLSRSTVHRSLAILHDIGLIEWIRRFHFSRADRQGARCEQTSNLYRFALPAWLAKRLDLVAPLPVDELARRDQAIEDHAEMVVSLSPVERARLMPSNPAVGEALLSAALRIDRRRQAEAARRECQINTAPPEKKDSSRMRRKESASSADAHSPDGPLLI